MNDTNNIPTSGFWASKHRNERNTKIFVTIVLALGSLVMMLPILWMISASFKDPIEVFKGWIPNPFHFENYPNAWNIVDPKTGRAMHASEDWDFFGITIHGIN